MLSSNSTNYSSSPCGQIVPCGSILSSSNGTSSYSNQNSNNCQPANCYRPLQQLYKTVYTPIGGNKTSTMNIECICRPAERYKTTNMTYGSFYYDNSLSTDRNLAINYDKAAFARCYDNTRNRIGYSNSNDRTRDTSIFSMAFDPQESQLWTQPTSDACCPIDCCHNTSFIPEKCSNFQTSTPCPPTNSQVPCNSNKSSNVQVRCV